MNTLFICAVIPCLNEEQSLEATCLSLGFGKGSHPLANAALILVDNGSTDRTQLVAREVQSASPAGAVILTSESERGYVPPRHCGNMLATKLAQDLGFSADDTLLVQADADTTYCDGYLEALRKTALANGPGTMFNARMDWPEDFRLEHSDFIGLCNEVDAEFESLLTDLPDDVIVDDKACAYRASDYERWGGHLREYTVSGDEIFSETTRLYIRARSYGASRCLCEDALARHSARRVLSEPVFCFATAGFPREAGFRAVWEQTYSGPHGLADFLQTANRQKIALAVTARRKHMWGLFEVLPTHVGHALGQQGLISAALSEDSFGLQRRDLQTVRMRPGLLLQDVLEIVDRQVFETKV